MSKYVAPSTTPRLTNRHRFSVASRALAGTLGAYVLASLATVALSLVLVAVGMNRVEATTGATLASFAIFAAIAMTVFHARTAASAWRGLIAGSLLLAMIIWALLPGP